RFNVTAPEGFGLRCLHAWRSEKVSDKHCSDDRVRECGGAGRLHASVVLGGLNSLVQVAIGFTQAAMRRALTPTFGKAYPANQ
ncbi:hypothetical protein, partial [Tahibacter aquaticus]|uniref:hypothetical protein n=1 Tax=Tahibacter aquaticus TaxID=520092 RepID=UPI001AAD4AA3